MKKVFISAFAIFLGLTSVAQDAKEVKLNVLGAIFNNYTLGYEHALSETGSVGLWVNYQQYNTETFNGNGEIVEDKISGIGFIPEYRFYFSPNDQIDGFFAGPYLKYASLSQDGSYIGYAEGSTTDTEFYENVKATSSRFVVGLNLGRKWATDGGFVFESTFGFGKPIADGVKYDNANVDSYREDNSIELLDINFDIRLGLSAGWRF